MGDLWGGWGGDNVGLVKFVGKGWEICCVWVEGNKKGGNVVWGLVFWGWVVGMGFGKVGGRK